MKVLHVCAGNLFGGVETYLVTLAKLRHLVPDMQPEFALCFRGRLWDELTATGVPIHDLGISRMSRPWTVLRSRGRIRQLMRNGYHQVILHASWALALFGPSVRRNGHPLICHMHNPTSRSWLDRFAGLQRPRLVIAPSGHSTETWRTLFPRARHEVLNYPLPANVISTSPLTPTERAAVRTGYGVTGDEVIILQASRMEPWKGVDRVVRSLGQLSQTSGWRFWVAGGVQRASEQVYADEVHRMARDLGIHDRVTFFGQTNEVPKLLRAADIYCQGNRGPEGFSLSFLEASYCGLPVVTTDIGGAGEMIDEQTGVLVPPGEDVGPLAAGLSRLIADPRLRSEMGLRAHEKAVRVSDPRQQFVKLKEWLRSVAA